MFSARLTKKLFFISLISIYLVFGLFFITDTARAEEFKWNRENWNTLPHPQVMSFYFNEDGEVFGTTTSNVAFRQINIPNGLELRIQKFEMQDYYHYIINGEVIYDLQRLLEILVK